MTRKVWDVHAFIGQRAHVKLIDFSSGGWGHINFDDLKSDISCVWSSLKLISFFVEVEGHETKEKR